MDTHWFKQWKKYVGFDSWDKYQMGDQNVYPGPVDNSGLLRGKTWIIYLFACSVTIKKISLFSDQYGFYHSGSSNRVQRKGEQKQNTGE